MSETKPELPPLRELSAIQIRRLLAADYLESIAKLIRKGGVDAFELSWNQQIEKPAGRVLITSESIQGPLELHFLEQIRKEQETIQVEDLSKELQDDPEVQEPDESKLS